ncbi:metacaspase-1-like [Juglans microcarpa x Juglans regia]|uniref:metacaspase-1-like n=1 Tax=Juglans microcarpa x Juglans regia TaxID=2249226 RepID=UPI001B7E1140|nr:metacaspase-1-like [Juglans microcarpa x Juglans regia]
MKVQIIMAGRRSRVEKCNRCGTQQWVPYETQIFKCGECRAIIQLPKKDNDHWLKVHDSVYPGVRFRNVVETAAPGLRAMPLNAGRKRAVLCGVTYKNSNRPLKGSVNDVKCMQYLLAEKFRFPKDSILILTEEEKDPFRIPTIKNIRMAMIWLVKGVQRGDSLVFYFSGHGSYVRDYSNDEEDGYNETLCPVDFETAGMIIDDEINATIVRPIPKGAYLHAIVDACHSGTILDLQHVYRPSQDHSSWEGKDGEWEFQECRSGVYKGTSGGLAISISACSDSQTSVDTTAFTGNVPTGALTYNLIQAVENEPRITYGRLIHSMRNAIREARNGMHQNAGSISSFVNKLRSSFSQETQLSSSERFDVSKKQFVL